MTIGIDISPACRKQKTGIEWYAWYVARGLLALSDGVDYRLYTDMPCGDFPNANVRTLLWPTRYLWPEVRESIEMITRAPDVLFVPSRALPLAVPKKVVATIHDVGFIPFPDERKRLSREYLLATSRRAARRADRIITVSEFAKGEIAHYFCIDPEKITVTHLGYDKERYMPRLDSRVRGNDKAPYILFVGRRERRKNLLRLIAAYELLKDALKQDTPDLVLVGPPGHHAAEIDQAIAQSRSRDSITIKNWVSEEEKISLLQHAFVCVQPSVYEGFGLPVIEAQACGTPVLCSRAASLPEIAGDAALLFDPFSPDDIAKTLSRVIQDKQLQLDLAKKGLENAQRFDWKITAQQTSEILQRVVAE